MEKEEKNIKNNQKPEELKENIKERNKKVNISSLNKNITNNLEENNSVRISSKRKSIDQNKPHIVTKPLTFTSGKAVQSFPSSLVKLVPYLMAVCLAV